MPDSPLLQSLIDDHPITTEPLLSLFAAKSSQPERRRSRAQVVQDDWSECLRSIKANPQARKIALFWLKEALPAEEHYKDDEFIVFIKFYWELHRNPEGRHSLDVLRNARYQRNYDETPATVGDLEVLFSEMEEPQRRKVKIEKKEKASMKAPTKKQQSATPAPPPKLKATRTGKISRESLVDDEEAVVVPEKEQAKKKSGQTIKSRAVKTEANADDDAASSKPAAHRSTNKRRKASESEVEDVPEQPKDAEAAESKRSRKKPKTEEAEVAEMPEAPPATEVKKVRRVKTRPIKKKETAKPAEQSGHPEAPERLADVPDSAPAVDEPSASELPVHEGQAPPADKVSVEPTAEPAPLLSQETEVSSAVIGSNSETAKGVEVEAQPQDTMLSTAVAKPNVEEPMADAVVEPSVNESLTNVAAIETPTVDLPAIEPPVLDLSATEPPVDTMEVVETSKKSRKRKQPQTDTTPAPAAVQGTSAPADGRRKSKRAKTESKDANSVPIAQPEPVFEDVEMASLPRDNHPCTPSTPRLKEPEGENGRRKPRIKPTSSLARPKNHVSADANSTPATQLESSSYGDADKSSLPQDDRRRTTSSSDTLGPESESGEKKKTRAKPTSEQPIGLAQLMNRAFDSNQDLNSQVDDDPHHLLGRKPPTADMQQKRSSRSATKRRAQTNASGDEGAPGGTIIPPPKPARLATSPGAAGSSSPFEGNPPIWAVSRQEVCETFPQFRSYQGGVYFNRNVVKGYLLSGFGSSRDAFLHGGKLIISHGGGKSESLTAARGQRPTMNPAGDQRSDDNSIRCLLQNYKNRIPLVLLADDKYTKLPYNMAERGIGYVVLGQYVIQHVWSEQEKISDSSGVEKYVVRYKFAFQWCESQGEPWWTRPLTETHDVFKEFNMPKQVEKASKPVKRVTVSQNELKPQYPPGLYQNCDVCHKDSPQVYSIGWVCTNPSCDRFWEVALGESFSHSPDLDFNPAFVTLIKSNGLVQINFPIPDRPPMDKWGTTLLCSRGFHCRKCGRLSCRWKWQHWECSNAACKDVVPVTFQIHHESDLRTSVPIRGDYRIPASSGVIIGAFQTFNCEGFKLHCQTFTFPNGGFVHQIRFKRHAVVTEPDQIFKEYQEQAADGTLPFCRWPLRTHKLKGSLLTNYFSQNCGEPYQYVGATEHTIPFDSAPSAVVNARRYLAKCIKTTIDLDTDFNEVLSAAYMQEQRMAYHSDDEKGLQPVVAGLSLGAPALMHFRFKAKHVPDPTKKGVLATFVLRHGDILVMNGAEMQNYYEHTVEPLDFRIAATARTILTS